MVNFITSNPAIAAIRAAEDNAYQREEREARRDARRTEKAKNKAFGQAATMLYDEPAIAGVVSTPQQSTPVPPSSPEPESNGPASPIAQVVAGPQQTPSPASPPQAAVPATPDAAPRARLRNQAAVRALADAGAGADAFRLAQQDRQSADAAEDKFVSLLATAKNEGDLNMVLEWGRRRGIKIPPEISGNRRQMARLIGAANVVRQLGLKGGQAQAAFKTVLSGGSTDDIVKNMGTPDKTIKWYDSMRGVGVTEDGQQVPIQGLPPRQVSPRSGGGSAGNRVQSTKVNERGELILVMRDGTVKKATDENGNPIKGPEARRLAGSLVGKLINDPLEKNPVGKAQNLAGQVWSGGTPTQPGNTGARPPLSSFER